ncbi:MAG: twitching motility protein PilU [Neolewinella sp.]|jgi:twitching motility protein PilU
MTFDDYLTILAKNDGSDLILSTGAPHCEKFQAKLKPLRKEPFLPSEIKSIAFAMMDSEQVAGSR